MRRDGLYGEIGAERIALLNKEFTDSYGDKDGRVLFSCGGRTEICGNHTDHNRGRVIAAAVDLDIAAVAAKNNDNIVRIYSLEFGRFESTLDELEMRREEAGTSAAIVRGTADGIKRRGYNIGGFDAVMTSDVPGGSGLSSSAAFEVIVGEMFSELYNGGAIDAIELAKIGQYAENEYFGKPCGLMDQTACAVGGIVAIDFGNPENPVIERLPLPELMSDIYIVDTGSSHADLTDQYAAIPAEMREVAAVFGKTVLREVCEEEFYLSAAEVRRRVGDRAMLRAHHFFSENRRVAKAVSALRNGDVEEFLHILRESGASSYMYNQNVFACGAVKDEPVAAALAISEHILGDKGAFRVHGGGFAGTIQAVVPCEISEEYREKIEAVFGKGSCVRLAIRAQGVCCEPIEQ